MTKLRHFSVGPIRFIRRPVSEELPPEGTMCGVDNGGDTGWSWRAAAVYRGGGWTDGRGKPLKHEPTHWTTFDVGGR